MVRPTGLKHKDFKSIITQLVDCFIRTRIRNLFDSRIAKGRVQRVIIPEGVFPGSKSEPFDYVQSVVAVQLGPFDWEQCNSRRGFRWIHFDRKYRWHSLCEIQRHSIFCDKLLKEIIK